jgi:hypothetical protein
MQVSLNPIVRAIPISEIESLVSSAVESLKQEATASLGCFASNVTPVSTLELEQKLFKVVSEFAKTILEKTFNSLEPSGGELPHAVIREGTRHRQLESQTPREIVTRFGKISLLRFRYRPGRKGKTIFPLEIALGVQAGFTPEAASLIGQQFAETGSSQNRTIEFAKQHLGSSIGPDRLRKLASHLAAEMEPHREASQVDQLQKWLRDAAKSPAKSVVLSVSRDAVALGLAPYGYFEMASVATISVLADGKKLGTVYLGRAPETNQKTLSQQLSSLLRSTIERCTIVPNVVYVTDAGKVETAYWKNVLSKFYVNGKRIKIHRVVDYFHASERLTIIADSIQFGADENARSNWLEYARRLLKKKGGHGRLMRSVKHKAKHLGIKSSKQDVFNKAVAYLKNQKRFMRYFEMKEQHFPIGSGVVESACKQIVSERMKLSGMRWKKPGAQVVMALRCIKLSKIWDNVFGRMLGAISPVNEIITSQDSVFSVSACA